MTTLRANPVAPCVTIMICVAGCSSTTTQDLPYSRTLPPPDFNRVPKAEQRIAARPVPPQRPAPKPITVDVPMAVLQGPKPTVLETQFEAVPDAYLEGKSPTEPAPTVKPFFTPIQSAEAILAPLIETKEPDAVVLPEPIAYPQYVSVGPEYFGPDSEIAPYVISRSETPPEPNKQYAETQPVVVRPERIVSDSGRYSVITEVFTPVPRAAPQPDAPQTPPKPAVEIAALVPPRPDPQPRQTPSDRAPRSPSRNVPDRFTSPVLRDEALDQMDDESAPPSQMPPTTEPLESPWRTTVETAFAAPEPDATPDDTLYRVRVAAPAPPKTAVASLDLSPPVIDTDILPQLVASISSGLSIVEPSKTAEILDFSPLPRQKPGFSHVKISPSSPGVEVAGTYSGITTEPLPPPQAQPATDPQPGATCFVNRGSNERMILICKGVHVSQAQVFRAVVEGESAFRGLRGFNDADEIIQTYGFNTNRFLAMSRGPRTARDLAFLRALRKSGKTVRVKGRSFELYLMKGDHNLATVLVEQAAVTPEQPAAIKLH